MQNYLKYPLEPNLWLHIKNKNFINTIFLSKNNLDYTNNIRYIILRCMIILFQGLIIYMLIWSIITEICFMLPMIAINHHLPVYIICTILSIVLSICIDLYVKIYDEFIIKKIFNHLKFIDGNVSYILIYTLLIFMNIHYVLIFYAYLCIFLLYKAIPFLLLSLSIRALTIYMLLKGYTIIKLNSSNTIHLFIQYIHKQYYTDCLIQICSIIYLFLCITLIGLQYHLLTLFLILLFCVICINLSILHIYRRWNYIKSIQPYKILRQYFLYDRWSSIKSILNKFMLYNLLFNFWKQLYFINAMNIIWSFTLSIIYDHFEWIKYFNIWYIWKNWNNDKDYIIQNMHILELCNWYIYINMSYFLYIVLLFQSTIFISIQCWYIIYLLWIYYYHNLRKFTINYLSYLSTLFFFIIFILMFYIPSIHSIIELCMFYFRVELLHQEFLQSLFIIKRLYFRFLIAIATFLIIQIIIKCATFYLIKNAYRFTLDAPINYQKLYRLNTYNFMVSFARWIMHIIFGVSLLLFNITITRSYFILVNSIRSTYKHCFFKGQNKIQIELKLTKNIKNFNILHRYTWNKIIIIQDYSKMYLSPIINNYILYLWHYFMIWILIYLTNLFFIYKIIYCIYQYNISLIFFFWIRFNRSNNMNVDITPFNIINISIIDVLQYTFKWLFYYLNIYPYASYYACSIIIINTIYYCVWIRCILTFIEHRYKVLSNITKILRYMILFYALSIISICILSYTIIYIYIYVYHFVLYVNPWTNLFYNYVYVQSVNQEFVWVWFKNTLQWFVEKFILLRFRSMSNHLSAFYAIKSIVMKNILQLFLYLYNIRLMTSLFVHNLFEWIILKKEYHNSLYGYLHYECTNISIHNLLSNHIFITRWIVYLSSLVLCFIRWICMILYPNDKLNKTIFECFQMKFIFIYVHPLRFIANELFSENIGHTIFLDSFNPTFYLHRSRWITSMLKFSVKFKKDDFLNSIYVYLMIDKNWWKQIIKNYINDRNAGLKAMLNIDSDVSM